MPRDTGTPVPTSARLSRRNFLEATAAGVGAAALGTASAAAEGRAAPSGAAARPIGLLYPQQNAHRNLLDLSGLWQFQLDPKNEGEAARWFERLPAPRTIAVP